MRDAAHRTSCATKGAVPDARPKVGSAGSPDVVAGEPAEPIKWVPIIAGRYEMIAVVGLIFPFFALIALGFSAGRATRRPVEGLAWLKVFVVYVALPALFFQLLSKTPVERLASPGFVAATTTATFAVLLAIALLSSWRLRPALGHRGAIPPATIQGLAGAYGNIGYMGPGLALAAFGPEAAVPVALVFCFDNTLHFVIAPLAMALGGEGRKSPAALVREVLFRIFSHPFIIATIVGLTAAVLHLQLPSPVERLLTLLSGAAAPCALFAMGVTLALQPLKQVPTELYAVVPAKLVLYPAIVWLFLDLTGPFDPVWVKTAILMACLPTATNVFVMAQQYGVWTECASAAVLTTTVLSVFTVTLALYWMSP